MPSTIVFPASGWQPRYITQYCWGQRVGAGVSVGPADVGESVGTGLRVGVGLRVAVGRGSSVGGGGSVEMLWRGVRDGACVGRASVGGLRVAVRVALDGVAVKCS